MASITSSNNWMWLVCHSGIGVVAVPTALGQVAPCATGAQALGSGAGGSGTGGGAGVPSTGTWTFSGMIATGCGSSWPNTHPQLAHVPPAATGSHKDLSTSLVGGGAGSSTGDCSWGCSSFCIVVVLVFEIFLLEYVRRRDQRVLDGPSDQVAVTQLDADPRLDDFVVQLHQPRSVAQQPVVQLAVIFSFLRQGAC